MHHFLKMEIITAWNIEGISNVKLGDNMKKLILLSSLILILFPFLCFANPNANVTFAWHANSETDLTGYRLYESLVSGQYTFGKGDEILAIPAGTETGTITVSGAGKRYYVLTAYNATDESGSSNEVDLTLLGSPTGLNITIAIKIGQ